MLSIAMTTYNGGKYLREQIDSILSQTIQEFELIICDDCSSDSTVAILKEYASKDKRIKFFENEFNLGYLKNFEKVIRLCSGEYIALSDQDDVWMQDHLEILYKAIVNRKCSLVGGNSLLVDSNNNYIGSKLINTGKVPNSKSGYEFLLLHRNLFQGAALMFDRLILEKALPFPEKIKFHDWWLALVASEEKGVFYIDVPIVRYRQHGENVTGYHHRDSLLEKIRKFFLNDLKAQGVMAVNILESFLPISNNKETVTKALFYAECCKNKKIGSVFYFMKNHNGIYVDESKKIFLIRVLKMLCNSISRQKKGETLWNH